jgi:hypothetical protein
MRTAAATLCCCVLAGALAPPARAGGAGLAVRPVPLPGGVADPAGRTGFFANATGGVSAVDLTTGDVLWETAEAEHPVLAAGDRLYAVAGLGRSRLRVLALDPGRAGACVLESDPVQFPSWVVVGGAPHHGFAAAWRLERGQLVLTWEADVLEPPPVPPDARPPAREHARGEARVDLRTGRVSAGPAPPADELPLPKEIEKKVVRWQGVVGGEFKALVLDEAGREQRAVLRSWDRAGRTEGPARELARGRRLVVRPTLDEHFLCVRDAAPSPDQKSAEDADRYAWSIFSVATGQRVARLPYDPGTQAVALLGTRAYCLVCGRVPPALGRPFVQPRSVRAVDLVRGKAMWERPLEGKPYAPPP